MRTPPQLSITLYLLMNQALIFQVNVHVTHVSIIQRTTCMCDIGVSLDNGYHVHVVHAVLPKYCSIPGKHTSNYFAGVNENTTI